MLVGEVLDDAILKICILREETIISTYSLFPGTRLVQPEGSRVLVILRQVLFDVPAHRLLFVHVLSQLMVFLL